MSIYEEVLKRSRDEKYFTTVGKKMMRACGIYVPERTHAKKRNTHNEIAFSEYEADRHTSNAMRQRYGVRL